MAEPLAALIIVALGFTHGFVYVEGRSMQPTLFPGDLIVYRRNAPRPARGEMVLFEHQGGLVVHRVAGTDRDGGLRTRGDANGSLDSEPVTDDEVRGIVVLVVPTGRAMAGLATRFDW